MTNIVIFASGIGTNAENIIKYFNGKQSAIRVVAVISNNPNAYVLTRAANLNIESFSLSKDTLLAKEESVTVPKREKPLREILKDYKTDYIILAGYLLKVPDILLKEYPDKIINIHPALLPKYGGKGMYGHHVHEAVIAAGEKESGITIHLVNEHYDSGRILFQAKCQISYGETPDDLAAKIHLLEQANFPQVIENYCQENSYQL
jgi:phosphoribosylglycinamide formyltransferase 1